MVLLRMFFDFEVEVLEGLRLDSCRAFILLSASEFSLMLLVLGCLGV